MYLAALYFLVALVWVFALRRKIPTISTHHLALGWSLYLFAQVFAGYWFFHIDWGPVPLTIDRVLLAALGLAWLTRTWQTKASEVRLDWVDGLVMAWIAMLGFSVATHDWSFRDQLPLSRLIFFNGLPFFAYVVIKQTTWTHQDLRLFSLVWLGIGGLLALIGIAEWKQWHAIVFPTYIVNAPVPEFLGRARGPLLNPMINGSLMLIGLSTALIAMCRVTGKLRAFLVVLITLILGGLFCTLTRSVWLSTVLLVSLIVLFELSWRWRIRFALTLLLIGGIAIFWGSDTLNHFKRDQHVSAAQMSESIKLRPMLAAVAWEMIQDHPVSGVGFGLYHKYKGPYHFTDKYEAPLQSVLQYTQHNVFLVYLIETGIFGTIFLVALIGMLLVYSLWGWREALRLKRPVDHLLVSGTGLASSLAYLVNGLFHDVSIIPMANFLILSHLGLLSSVFRWGVVVEGFNIWEYFARRLGIPPVWNDKRVSTS